MGFLILDFFWFLLTIAALSSTAEPMTECIKSMIDLTQSCTSHNHLYVTTMGQTSGIGSEFNFYLMNSLKTAVIQNRRMIYLASKRPWEYDCKEKLGWACYFTFLPCPDGNVSYSQMDLNQRNVHNLVKEPGSAFQLPETTAPNNIPGTLIDVMRTLHKAYEMNEAICPFASISVDNLKRGVLGGIIATRLYQLNDVARTAIDTLNAPYKDLIQPGRKFASFQLRLTDKKHETPEKDWAKISDMHFIAERLSKVLQIHADKKKEPLLKDFFVATDNCTAAGEVLVLLRQASAGVRMFGTCFHADGRGVHDDKKRWQPRSFDHPNHGMAALADVDMLRRGDVFVGSFHSNFVRMVHYLRYPNMRDSYHFIEDEPWTADMANLHWEF